MSKVRKLNQNRALRRITLIPALLVAVLTLFSWGGNTGLAYTDVPIPETKPHPKALKATYKAKPVLRASLKNFMKSGQEKNTVSEPGVLIPISVAARAAQDIPIPTHKPDLKKQPFVNLSKTLFASKSSNNPPNASNKDLYRKIFTLQADGKMKEADALIARLSDQSLLGHVLYQRYMHPTAYKSSFDELKSWLEKYSDHAGANRIYTLAKKKRPASFRGSLNKPDRKIRSFQTVEPTMQPAQPYKTSLSRTAEQKQQVRNLRSAIKAHLKNGAPTQALNLLQSDPVAKLLDDVEYDIQRSEIAASYYYEGKARKAFEVASPAAKRSMLNVPLAGWIGGLSAWRLGQHKVAAPYFEVTARSPYVSGWVASAGSYWAARSHMRSGNVKDVSKWYKKAADYPRTFYGLAATRALGQSHDFNWNASSFTDSDHKWLNADAHGRRAIALVAANQFELAAEELKAVPTQNAQQRQALIAYAENAGLPSLSLRLGGYFSRLDKASYDSALYPVGSWLNHDEYRVEPELVHAIIRQESKFDPSARSYSGASGLMQVIPSTAAYVSGDRSLKTSAGRHKLHDPKINLGIGQSYIKNLLGNKNVNGNLLNLLIAYNAGPGNLNKWKKNLADIDDSLLFIESIPSSETRAYVERVIANYWVYKMRSGNEVKSLDAIASGEIPYYRGFDQKAYKLVSKN